MFSWKGILFSKENLFKNSKITLEEEFLDSLEKRVGLRNAQNRFLDRFQGIALKVIFKNGCFRSCIKVIIFQSKRKCYVLET